MKKFKDTTIEEQKKYFKVYSYLPLIIASIILFLFFVWGIIDPIKFYKAGGYYGIMGLRNGFLCWLVWMIIGAVFAGIVYIIGKIALSQKILTVLYLQSIAGNSSDNTTVQTDSDDKTNKELEVYKQLFESGTITEEDYNAKKKELLGL